MNLAVSFRRAARAEFIETAAWYELQRPTLGAEFITGIDRCVALASGHPCRYPVVHGDIRRIVAERFPYSVYYRAEADRVVVLTVFHASRNPLTWHQKT